MAIDRRQLIASIGALAAASPFSPALGAKPTAPFTPPAGPRSRVVYVNDLSGDIDGLFATVHAILSPAIDLRAIVGTGATMPGETARRSAELANEMLALMSRTARVKTYEGAAGKLTAADAPVRSPGTQAIIDEALRTDTSLPLFVAVGGGLTEVASALMLEPRIAERMTLVWIGGGTPNVGTQEANFSIDPLAARHVYNATNVPIWQVPSDVYKTCLVSDTELQAFVAPCGAIGQWLYARIFEMSGQLGKYKLNTGETWTLGDSPLVVLTALNDWPPSGRGAGFAYLRTGSSRFEEMIAPRLDENGAPTAQAQGRKMRLYSSIDTRLMFGDFFAKLRINFPPS
jgi:inosine-uridine nucleoside N-ribohydrolase